MAGDQTLKALTEHQRAALLWIYKKGGRSWMGSTDGLNDPSPAALTALVRKGLVKKRGGDGWPAHYELTPAGEQARATLVAAVTRASAN